MKSDSIIKMAGDPRQVTYHTHFSDKYKKYSDGKIQEFVLNECKKINCNVDWQTGYFQNIHNVSLYKQK